MGLVRPLIAFGLAGGAAGAVAGGGCANATAIGVEVFTDLPCTTRPEVVVVGGPQLGDLVNRAPSTNSSACTERTGRVGQLIVLPSDGDQDGVAFAVATRLDGQPPDACVSATPPKGCIVARRQIKFLRHSTLQMRLDLRASCADVVCPGDQTCVMGGCVPALVGDCASGCTDSDLLPPGVPASGPPYWAGVTPMPTPRYYTGAALGGDNRIYLIGGEAGARTRLAVNESYDAFTDTWRTDPPMPAVNSAMGAATGPDGNVYVFGGYATRAVLGYAPGTGQWTTYTGTTPLPTGRAFNRAVTGPDGLIYVLGGDNLQATADLKNVEAFDPRAPRWQVMPPLPTGRGNLAASPGPDGRIYAFGGDSVTTPGNGQAFDAVEAYDTSTRTWSTLPKLPALASGLYSALGPDGRIYIAAGKTLYVYATDRTAWDRAIAYPTEHSVASVVTGPDGRIYVFGNTAAATMGVVEAYGPVLEGVPNPGGAGARFTLRGRNFAAFAGVSVHLDRASDPPIATGRTDVLGEISPPIDVTLPAGAAGTHWLVVQDNRSRFPVRRPTTL